MSKTNKIYKIFMTTMIVAIAGMLLAMGIIAAQRTMKVNVAFPANPYYKIEIWIQKNGDEEKLAFCNFEDKDLDKEIVMQNGISSLDGNTIQANNSFFTKYENEFYIIIKNYTESTGIEVSMSSTGQVDENTAGIPAQFDPIKTTASKFNTTTKIPDYIKFDVFANAVFPQTTTLKIEIEEHNGYSVTFNTMVDCNAENTEIGVGEDFEIDITPTVDYDAYYYDYSITINNEPYTHYGHSGTLNIPAEDITGNINISASAFECWDGNLSETDYSPTNYDSNNPFQINSPGDLANMMHIVRNTTGRAYNNDIFDNITFSLNKDIYLNDEDFIYEEDTGYVYITDGVNEGWLGTGAKGTTLYSWKNDVSYNGLLYEWVNYCGDDVGYYFIGFTGNFYGNSHKVSGMYQNTEKDGLFGGVGAMYFDGDDDDIGFAGAVYNLGIVNSISHAGSFARIFDGNMLNCFNEGVVLGESCGGLAAQFGDSIGAKTKIVNCYNSGFVIGTLWVGGLSCGGDYSEIQNCINFGKIIQYGVGAVVYVGGCFADDFDTDLKNCYNLGLIEIQSNVSGYFSGIGGRERDYYAKAYDCYFLQTTTINASLNVGYGYSGTDCGTINSLDALIPRITIYSLDGTTSEPCTNITVLQALNKAVELTASSSYKTWQSINPPQFGGFWSA